MLIVLPHVCIEHSHSEGGTKKSEDDVPVLVDAVKDQVRLNLYYSSIDKHVLLPRAHAQRSKVIGSVVVVVAGTKIARSRILGEFTSATCS